MCAHSYNCAEVREAAEVSVADDTGEDGRSIDEQIHIMGLK